MNLNKNYLGYLLLLIIILSGLLLRLYFFDKNVELDVSDESEYAMMINSFSKGEIIMQWPFYRPFLLPFIWGLMGKIGFGLLTFRISIIIFSLLSILLSYLIAKDIFNKKIGLLTALFVAFFPDEILHSVRFLLNGPALMMWLLSLYLFQKAYFKKSDLLLYLSGLVTGLGILIYNQNIVIIGFYFIFLLFTEGTKFIKEKRYIYFFIIQFLLYLINFVYSYVWFNNPLKSFGYGLWLSVIDSHSRSLISVIIDFIKYLPKYISFVYVIIFLISLIIIFKQLLKIIKPVYLERKKFLKPSLISIGLLFIFFIIQYFLNPFNYSDPKKIVLFYLINTIITIIFGLFIIYLFRELFDIISKNLNENSKKHLFLMLWLFTAFFLIAKMVGFFQARYFLAAIIPIFIYVAYVINYISIKIDKKIILILFLIILSGLFLNFYNAKYLVGNYDTDYGNDIVGHWIKNNSDKEDVIFGPTNYAMAYYSSRKWYKYPVSQTFEGKTYENFLNKINEFKPKYIVIDNTEKYENDNEFYIKYINDNNLKIVYSYINPKNYVIEVYDVKLN